MILNTTNDVTADQALCVLLDDTPFITQYRISITITEVQTFGNLISIGEGAQFYRGTFLANRKTILNKYGEGEREVPMKPPQVSGEIKVRDPRRGIQ